MYPCQIIQLSEPVTDLTPAWLAATALVSPASFPPRPERLPGVSRLISTGRTVRSCCSRPARPAAEAVPGSSSRRARARPGRGASESSLAWGGPAAAPRRPLAWRLRRGVLAGPAPGGSTGPGRDGGEQRPHSAPTATPLRPHRGPTAALQRPYSGPTADPQRPRREHRPTPGWRGKGLPEALEHFYF